MRTDLVHPLEPLWARRPRAERVEAARLSVMLADLVVDALLAEVCLTPKPGLVDLRNTGSHRDMDVATFRASAAALRPRLPAFFLVGVAEAETAAMVARERLRPIGLDCERAMLAATNGVNTHKGSIFAFGLLLGAAGRLWATTGEIDREAICDEVAHLVEGIVSHELDRPGPGRTAGERLFHLHGLAGARGEAASGFATVREVALPVYEAALGRGHAPERALLGAFLHLLAENDDTNLAARGGLHGLRWAQIRARALLAAGGIDQPDLVARMEDLDDRFIERNLSPGGSADLLAMTLVLHALGDERRWRRDHTRC